ncbi:MAG: ABC transporter substrate-binding protein, partial [Mesorhizobium sp.]
YCNKDIDARGQAADAMPVPAKAEERNKAWAQIFTDIQTNDAPWIPVFNERRVVAKAKRMGGPDEIYIDPTRVINYEAIYVNK